LDTTTVYGGTAGRHRRVDPHAVVHLVFADGGEVSFGPESPVGSSICHLAVLLADW
jgi:hypothetical protein